MAVVKKLEGGVMLFDLTHAKHDRAHCLCPGLFRSLKRGERKKLKLDVTYDFGNEETIRFIGFEPLDAYDLRLLQTLVAYSGPKGILLKPEPKTEVGQQLRLFLEPELEAAEQNALVVKEPLTKILKEMGLSSDGKANLKVLEESLTRMSNVTVVVHRGRRVASFHLLSYAIDPDDGRILVALNPRITRAVLGEIPHVWIEMDEVRRIRLDVTRLIHQRLCAWIDPGGTGSVAMDTLISYAWPDPVDPKSSGMRMRRKRVREALEELKAIGWIVNEYARCKFEIVRPPNNRSNSDDPP